MKNELLFNRPTYIGSTILDLSKLLMYEFHYDYMFNKYGNKAELIYTDTDSFVYDVKTEDLYKDMYEDKDKFDLHEVSISKFQSNDNKKVVGKFKCETNMRPITEFVALKPKLYSFLILGDDKTHSKAKGVTKTSQKDIKHEDYKRCLETNMDQNIEQIRIQTFKRHVYTIKQNKKALSNYEDKMYRYDAYRAYSYGHKDLKN
jgi:hypothetical protein